MKVKIIVLMGASLLSSSGAFLTTQQKRTGNEMARRAATTAPDISVQTMITTPPKARDIWTVLSTRYHNKKDGPITDWTKTRNYIYHTVDKLPLSQVNDVCAFLDTHFEQEMIVSILQRSPRILRKSVASNLIPTTEFLQNLYGDDLFQKAVSRNPDLLLSTGLGYNSATRDNSEHTALETYLQEELQMSKSKITKLQKSSPFFFQIPLTKIQHVTQFLTDLLNRGIDQSEEATMAIVTKVMVNHPHLFHLSVADNLQPRMEFLTTACQLSEKNVAALIKSSSGILGLSVNDNLKPTLDYLAELLVVDGTDDDVDGTASTREQLLNKCVMSHPAILALSQKNMATKVNYFNAMDVDGGSLAARVALRSPVVYSLSLMDNIVPKVEFLSHVWGTPPPPTVECRDSELCIISDDDDGNDDDATLATYLRDYPSVLTLSLEGNLQPTMQFYNKTGYTALTNDWDLVSAKPIRGRYITASLYNRLLPRWHYWKEFSSQTLKPPLHTMVGATDAVFCKQFDLKLQDYLTFKEDSTPRLKFSSQFDTWLKTGRAIDME